MMLRGLHRAAPAALPRPLRPGPPRPARRPPRPGPPRPAPARPAAAATAACAATLLAVCALATAAFAETCRSHSPTNPITPTSTNKNTTNGGEPLAFHFESFPNQPRGDGTIAFLTSDTGGSGSSMAVIFTGVDTWEFHQNNPIRDGPDTRAEPHWDKILTGAGDYPDARAEHALATLDDDDGLALLFGGWDESHEDALDDTWIYDSTKLEESKRWKRWEDQQPIPPARLSHGLALLDHHNTTQKTVLLFGGRNLEPPTFYNDTWRFVWTRHGRCSGFESHDQGRWEELTPVKLGLSVGAAQQWPAARGSFAMFNFAHGHVILYGGCLRTASLGRCDGHGLSELWHFTTTDGWVQTQRNGDDALVWPPRMSDPAMVHTQAHASEVNENMSRALLFTNGLQDVIEFYSFLGRPNAPLTNCSSLPGGQCWTKMNLLIKTVAGECSTRYCNSSHAEAVDGDGTVEDEYVDTSDVNILHDARVQPIMAPLNDGSVLFVGGEETRADGGEDYQDTWLLQVLADDDHTDNVMMLQANDTTVQRAPPGREDHAMAPLIVGDRQEEWGSDAKFTGAVVFGGERQDNTETLLRDTVSILHRRVCRSFSACVVLYLPVMHVLAGRYADPHLPLAEHRPPDSISAPTLASSYCSG